MSKNVEQESLARAFKIIDKALGFCYYKLAKREGIPLNHSANHTLAKTSEEKRRHRKMQKILLVIDMQNDFIDGALGTKEAVAIVPNVIKRIKEFDGSVFFTRDTHEVDYLNTQEGRNLPVEHCIRGSKGWEIRDEIDCLRKNDAIDKPSFGSDALGEMLRSMNEKDPIESVTIIGLCTDICVISNAMIAKAFIPEVPIIVDANCCAGVSPKSHENALKAMEVCQIKVLR